MSVGYLHLFCQPLRTRYRLAYPHHMTNEALNLPDHEDRMRQVRRRVGWELGDRSWADIIIGAYLDPDSDRERLDAEMKEKEW
jgi:hypothetical protein